MNNRALRILAVVTLAASVLSGCSSAAAPGSGSSAGASSDTATPTLAASEPNPSPSGSGQTPDISGLPTRSLIKDEVGLEQAAAFGDGVKAEITDVRRVKSDGVGVGDLATPSVAVTVQITNGSKRPIDATAVNVNGYYGADLRPASVQPTDTRNDPIGRSIGPGESATGTYVFALPSDSRAIFTVAYSGSSPLVAFKGTVE